LNDQQVPQYAGQTINCTQCQRAFTVPANPGRQTGVRPSVAPAPMTPAGAAQVNYASAGPYIQPQTNGMAIASVVLGAAGFILPVLASVPAIILGILGLKRTRNPAVGGKGTAITGIALGATSLVLGVVVWGCMLSILLPSLNRARETANRVKCAANLKAVGSALLLYANENRGSYPPNFQTLIDTQDITFDSFVCPSSSDQRANQMSDLSTPGHLSYVYVPGMTIRASAQHVIVYERITDHNQAGANFLFGDGHVEWLARQQAQSVIAQLEKGQNPPR
jgi:prepilin-type processing-associated H-X9-DG protein